jgi:hypothetical protein
MKTSIKFFAAAAAAVALGSIAPVWAQQASDSPAQQATGQGKGQGMGMQGHGKRGGHGRAMPTAADVTARLDRLKAELQITPEQAQAWQQFADTARSQAEARAARRAQMQDRMQARQTPADGSSAAPPADRDALRAQMKQQRDADRTARDAARAALYAVLSPEQKALADQKLRSARHQGHRHGHRHGAQAGARAAS